MRHLRILGLCVAAIFAMSATTLVVASPALAGGCNQECKEQKEKEKLEAKARKEKEKQEAKEIKEHEKQEAKEKKQQEKEEAKRQKELEKTGGEYGVFRECSLYGTACVFGEAGPESYFQAGKAVVHFVHPVDLYGGIHFNAEEEPEWVPPLNGESIPRVEEPAPSLTEGVDAALLPPRELKRYEQAVASGKTIVTATIEMANPNAVSIHEGNLLFEEGIAMQFGVMIHLKNKWLGPDCYVGSTEQPIVVPFTTGETNPEPPNTPIHGYAGTEHSNTEGTILTLEGARLVNNEYASPGVHGCGVDSQADRALDAALELPSPAGRNSTELTGQLKQAASEIVEEHIRFE